jgi:YbgC/YbaW family acyl-CoA thioester hydrolase
VTDGSEIRFHHDVEVRFKDVDVGGHAHHSHALVYMEEARAAYWRDVARRPELSDVDYILAEARVRYHSRILYPQRLRVGVRTSVLGKRHFEMEYEVRGASGDLLASGSTTQVMYDYGKGEAMSIPAEIRDAVDAFDGPFGPGGRRTASNPDRNMT